MRPLRTTIVVVLVLAFRACVIGAEECQSDSECDSSQACQNYQCINPCQSNTPCVANGMCEVINHLLHCLCYPGYTGNPYRKCSSINVTECTSDNDCSSNTICSFNKCVDPCVIMIINCGLNAVCKAVEHRPSCECSPGYTGDPFQQCDLECTSDNDCSSTTTCIYSKCVDPCETMILKCGDNAVCKADEHRPSCECSPCYFGDPFQGCNSRNPSPKPYVPKRNRYSAVTLLETDWRGAIQYCQSIGRRLAVVQSVEDHSQILTVIGHTGKKDGHFWTAGTDQYATGNWIWESTGQPFNDFSYWHVSQPDNFAWVEHCMEYWGLQVGYRWNDRPCDFKANIICEEVNNKNI